MRFRVDVAAREAEMSWANVHGPVRAVVYDLIRSQDPELAQDLHDVGWQGSPLRPLGASPPLFAGAKRRRGVYTTSARGSVWFGSPVPRISACLLAAVAGRGELCWGSTRLAVRGVQLEQSPDHSSGERVFESVSPVLVKYEDRFLLPDDAMYEKRLVHNLRHKADVLGLPNGVEIEILEAGPRRRFDVQQGVRIGATVQVRVEAAPAFLDALYDWGLGLATNQGFGWLR